MEVSFSTRHTGTPPVWRVTTGCVGSSHRSSHTGSWWCDRTGGSRSWSTSCRRCRSWRGGGGRGRGTWGARRLTICSSCFATGTGTSPTFPFPPVVLPPALLSPTDPSPRIPKPGTESLHLFPSRGDPLLQTFILLCFLTSSFVPFFFTTVNFSRPY